MIHCGTAKSKRTMKCLRWTEATTPKAEELGKVLDRLKAVLKVNRGAVDGRGELRRSEREDCSWDSLFFNLVFFSFLYSSHLSLSFLSHNELLDSRGTFYISKHYSPSSHGNFSLNVC